MIQYKHILMTLALLLTAVTGAWAADTYTITFSGFGNEACNKTVTDATLEYSETFYVTDVYANYTILGGVGGSNEYVSISKSQDETKITITVKSAFEGTVNVTVYYMNENWDESERNISVTCVKSAPAIDVKWDSATKTGSFEMPAYDVEIAPIYAPTAVFATDGNLVLTPTAIEGIYAESTEAIVKAGTVAKIGETENPQGIVMYAVTSTNQATAPALTAFSATLPTAKNITIGSDVLVWYYIKGADTPEGQTATAENTFNDSEICATPLTVTVLSNKYDIQFNAANANTIEAGKATVKVGETAAEVKEGKLTGVKMGSKVTITAKDGYKFRKAEGKDAAAAKTITIGDMELTYADGDTWETIVSKNSDKIKTLAGRYIVQVAQPAPNEYRYIHVWYTAVKPSDIIDPSKNYQWSTLEVNS